MRVASRLFGLLLVLAAGLPGFACAAQLVATVEGVPITSADIELRMRTDPDLRFKSVDSAAARAQALRSLVVEIAAEHALRSAIQRDGELTSLLDQTRRQKIIELYDLSSTQDITLVPGEVEAFVARNPQFFKDRKTWHYHEVVVRARTAAATSEMRAHAAQISALEGIGSGEVGPAFQWAQEQLYDTMQGNRWQGSEEIDAPVFSVLQTMQSSGRRIHADCVQDTCTFLVLHDSYPDPIDPVAMGTVLETTLLAQKRSSAYDNIHRHLLKTVQIEFHDPAIAERSGADWGRLPYLTATAQNRSLWIAVFALAGLVVAWAFRQFRGGGLMVEDAALRPRWTARLSDRAYARFYGPAMQRFVAAVVVFSVLAEAGWVLAETAFVKFTHDFAWVAGGCVVAWVGAGVLWRYAPQIRPWVERRRFLISMVVVAQGLLALFSGLLG